MTINVSWTITCENWLESDIGECDINCDAGHDGDNFIPDADWITVEHGNDEDEGEHYCPKCAERLGKVDTNA
ncbi:MAG: hypothetical protein H7123_08125 [Thermoleophilia bacterium]|nr:hypothetical protein [Thermoleophilia bacterium]